MPDGARNIRIRYEYPLPGGGPWAILERCPASAHNTLTAATRGTRATGGARCVCPRGRSLYEARLEEQRLKRNADPVVSEKMKALRMASPKVPKYMTNIAPDAIERPDFRHANCRNDAGRAIIDALDAESNPSKLLKRLAQKMCDDCPIFRECRTWILVSERPAGSWGLYYAGMNVAQRKAMR